MSNTFVEITLDKNLSIYVFILPHKNPSVKVTTEQISVENFVKNDSLTLKAMKIPVKRLETRAYASIPCILLFYLVKNPTCTIASFDLSIFVDSQSNVSIHELSSQAVDQKELKIQFFELTGANNLTFPIVLNSNSDGFVQFNLKGSTYVDMRKINISKRFGLESVLPFYVSSKVRHISKFDYMLELAVTNLMPFDITDISYTFTANSTTPKYFPKALFANSIKSLVTMRKMIPISGTPAEAQTKKFGKIKIFWKVDESKEYSSEIQEEPAVDESQTIPDYLMISVKSCPKDVFVNTQFDFEIEIINVSTDNLTFTAQCVNTEDVGTVNTEPIHYSAELGYPITINFSAIPVREGLVKLPPIKFVLDNSSSFTYTSPSGVLVRSPPITHM